MDFEQFKQDVDDRIKDFLPEKYGDADVSIQSVVKNNDQKLAGRAGYLMMHYQEQ